MDEIYELTRLRKSLSNLGREIDLVRCFMEVVEDELQSDPGDKELIKEMEKYTAIESEIFSLAYLFRKRLRKLEVRAWGRIADLPIWSKDYENKKYHWLPETRK